MKNFQISSFFISLLISKLAISAQNLPSELVSYMNLLEAQYSLISDKYLEPYIQKNVQNPTRIISDFNGDKNVDYALLVKDKNDSFELLVFLKDGKGFSHQILQQLGKIRNPEQNIGIYIQEQEPGMIMGFPLDNIPKEDLIAHLEYTGIHLFYFEKSSVLYYWKSNSFKDLWTSD